MIGKPLIGYPRLIALGITGLAIGLIFANAFGVGGFASSATRIPMAYQIARIPGGTTLRLAMIHDVLHERYLRHGDAWNEEQIRQARLTLAAEQKTPRLPAQPRRDGRSCRCSRTPS
jgi:hypothetical protein